jgi:hypothetical protein
LDGVGDESTDIKLDLTDGWIESLNQMVGSKLIAGLDRKRGRETEEGCIETDDRIETIGSARLKALLNSIVGLGLSMTVVGLGSMEQMLESKMRRVAGIDNDDRIETDGRLRMNVTDGWLVEGSGIETEEDRRETESFI